MVLLVIISLTIYQSTTQSYKLRDVLLNEGDFHNGIRLAMGLLDRDVTLLYSPILLNPRTSPGSPAASPAPDDPNFAQDPNRPQTPAEQAETQLLEQLRASPLSQTTEYWGPVRDTTMIRPSRFQGAADRMSFISASHIRIYKEAPETELTKVRYELRDDKSELSPPDTKMLVRITNSRVFDDISSQKDESERVMPVLRGIKKWGLKYYRRDKQTWEPSWDSEREDLVGRYPDAIEVEVEVQGPLRLNFTGRFLMKPEIPLGGLDARS
jgi:hypothetical protein